jgi:hypothetical protein
MPNRWLTRADLLYRVRAQVIFEAHLVGGEIRRAES